MSGVFVVCLASYGCKPQEPEDFSGKLYFSYEQMREALQDKDVDKYRKYCSKFTYISSKNQAVSAGIKFRDFLEQISFMADSLDGMDELLIKQDGDTARMVLFGMPSDAEPMEGVNIVPSYKIIDFVKEEDQWKVHYLDGKRPSEVEGGEEAVASGDHAAVLSKDVFTSPIIVPEVPQEVTSVEAFGRLEYQSYDYRTRVWINGQNQHPRRMREDATGGGPIIGGLKSGENTIKIHIERIEDGSKLNNPIPYSVKVIKLDFGKDGDTRSEEIFIYKPEEIPSDYEASFDLNSLTTKPNAKPGQLPWNTPVPGQGGGAIQRPPNQRERR